MSEKEIPGAPDPAPPDRPFVFINMAMTADGKIATANRVVSSFGSRRDHGHLLELRATADAVMAGARTVDLNPINLGPGPARYRRERLRRGLAEYNLRVLVSGSASLNPAAEVFRHRFSPLLLLTTAAAPPGRVAALTRQVDAVHVSPGCDIDFGAALRWLHAQWGVRRLLCEGGGGLNDALFRAGLVDQLHLTICPLVFGGREAPTIADGRGFTTLAEAACFEPTSARRVGGELFAVYDLKKPSAHPPPETAASWSGSVPRPVPEASGAARPSPRRRGGTSRSALARTTARGGL